MSDRFIENVISLAQRRSTSRATASGIVVDHWARLAEGTQPPMRAQIDPRQIQDALEYAFIAERVTARLARLRVAGQHIADLAGRPVAGMPLACLCSLAERDRLGEAIGRVFEENACLRVHMQAEGQPQLQAELTMLPLRSDLGDTTRMLGTLTSTGRIGRSPRRFRILTVAQFTPTCENLPSATQTTRSVPECTTSKRRSHAAPLRLVVDNS